MYARQPMIIAPHKAKYSRSLSGFKEACRSSHTLELSDTFNSGINLVTSASTISCRVFNGIGPSTITHDVTVNPDEVIDEKKVGSADPDGPESLVSSATPTIVTG